MSIKVKQLYCLIEDGEVTSTWDKVEEKGEYIVCSKMIKGEGLALYCCNNYDGKPSFAIGCIKDYKLTKHGVIFAEQEITSKTSHYIRYGFISYDGRYTIPAKYNKITCLQIEDYLCVQKYAGGTKGLYNYMGEELLPVKYDNFEEFSTYDNSEKNSAGVIYEENGKKGIYFFESEKVIEPKYKSAKYTYVGIIVQDIANSKYGLFSLNGECLLTTIYDSIENISFGEHILVGLCGRYEILNLSNKECIHSGEYEYVKVCKEHFYKYCEIKLYDKEDTYLYIPDINTFVKGITLRVFKTGKIQYLPSYNSKWQDITKDMYDNADKFQNLYESEETK